jgi:hypothetical protein
LIQFYTWLGRFDPFPAVNGRSRFGLGLLISTSSSSTGSAQPGQISGVVHTLMNLDFSLIPEL